MKTLKTLTLKVSEDLLKVLSDRAMLNYRSINKEALFLINQGLNAQKEGNKNE